MSDLWGWRDRPADPEELAAAEDRVYRDTREPYEWPDPAQQYRTALARRPTPGRPARRTDQTITTCGWDPGAA